MPVQRKIQSVLIKPAGPDCNMRCRYCFYLEKAAQFPDVKRHRMTPAILREVVRQVMGQGDQQVSFGWQGGEPTLMGLSFFEQAVNDQIRYGRPGQICGNGLQTNGLLIDSQWACFLAESRFLVGLSLDGPEHVHNRYRLLKNRQPSWSRVVRARDELLEAGVEVNALVVVNDYSAQFADEIYGYHKNSGLTFMQFIACLEPDASGSGKPASYSVSPSAYGDFLNRLFDLWIADFKDNQPATYIRWFESLFFTYVNRIPPECTLLKECGIYVVIEHNGDVFSCDFYVEPAWRLGNLMEKDLSECLNSDLQFRFGAAKADVPDRCLVCPWLEHCRGGCPKDRQFSDVPRLNYFCESYRMFFEHADPIYRSLAQQWVKTQTRESVLNYLAETGSKIERNAPCPCGSGKKFKQCCGQRYS
jgi:uncharacterized protein